MKPNNEIWKLKYYNIYENVVIFQLSHLEPGWKMLVYFMFYFKILQVKNHKIAQIGKEGS